MKSHLLCLFLFNVAAMKRRDASNSANGALGVISDPLTETTTSAHIICFKENCGRCVNSSSASTI